MDSGKKCISQRLTVNTSIVRELLANDKNRVCVFQFVVHSRVLEDGLVDFQEMSNFGEWLRREWPRILQDIIDVFSTNKPDMCCASRELRNIVYRSDNLIYASDLFVAAQGRSFADNSDMGDDACLLTEGHGFVDPN